MSEKIAGRIIIQNEEGEVLLGRRTSKADFGKLSIPGGKPNKDEDIKKAATREVLEETGMQINDPDFFIESDFKGWITSFYFSTLSNIIVPPPNEEHSEFLLLSQEEIETSEEEIGFNHFDILKSFFENRG